MCVTRNVYDDEKEYNMEKKKRKKKTADANWTERFNILLINSDTLVVWFIEIF